MAAAATPWMACPTGCTALAMLLRSGATPIRCGAQATSTLSSKTASSLRPSSCPSPARTTWPRSRCRRSMSTSERPEHRRVLVSLLAPEEVVGSTQMATPWRSGATLSARGARATSPRSATASCTWPSACRGPSPTTGRRSSSRSTTRTSAALQAPPKPWAPGTAPAPAAARAGRREATRQTSCRRLQKIRRSSPRGRPRKNNSWMR
mmetsp:Transcript_81060/g.206040  ORF Transcript_81060/g.206040 Transcript_81060/m.206040 type:complete len:207 (-) Transcript_81060:1032-1652(-)